MTMTSALGRPLLAGMFLYGGLDAVRNPESKAAKAEPVATALAEPLGLPPEVPQLVRINGWVQVIGGGLLVLGKAPRLASLALAASLVPTTYAGHRFWEESEPGPRRNQTIHFLKNVSMLGGLLVAVSDTGGRPSLSWRARRAAKVAGRSASRTAEAAAEAARSRAEAAADVARSMAGSAREALPIAS